MGFGGFWACSCQTGVGGGVHVEPNRVQHRTGDFLVFLDSRHLSRFKVATLIRSSVVKMVCFLGTTFERKFPSVPYPDYSESLSQPFKLSTTSLPSHFCPTLLFHSATSTTVPRPNLLNSPFTPLAPYKCTHPVRPSSDHLKTDPSSLATTDETLSKYNVVCDEKYSEDVMGIWDAFERWMNPSSRSSSDRGRV